MSFSIIDYAFIPFLILIQQGPTLIAHMVGIGLAIARWKRHPRASLLAIIALSLFILQGIVFSSVSVLAPMWLTAAQISSIYMGLSVIRICLNTIAWGVLIAALFLPRPLYDPDDDGMDDYR